ncbi:hypothetical protein J4474_03240 [Candidatus Pacearchaeota archaeon]|nr:hypothetical protein [Candidatus Pacearchaeota archaeon]
MRTGLIIFGVIFLVVGALLYFVPMQQIQADTTTTEGGNTDTRTSSASVTVPVQWAYATGIIGLILLVMGLAIPSSNRKRDSKKDSYNTVVESKENIKVGDGNKRKIIREKTERHNLTGDKNDK